MSYESKTTLTTIILVFLVCFSSSLCLYLSFNLFELKEDLDLANERLSVYESIKPKPELQKKKDSLIVEQKENENQLIQIKHETKLKDKAIVTMSNDSVVLLWKRYIKDTSYWERYFSFN